MLRREDNRQAEIKELTSKGIIPSIQDVEQHPEKSIEARPWLMGRVAAVRIPLSLLYSKTETYHAPQLIDEVLPAKVIVDNMVEEAASMLQLGGSLVKVGSKAKL